MPDPVRAARVWLPVCLALVAVGCLDPVGQPPRTLTLHESFISPEGWPGTRVTANHAVLQEWLDSLGNDQRLDRWRYYEDGRLRRVLCDVDGDDLIDVRARFDPPGGGLRLLERYAGPPRRRILQVRYRNRGRWEQRADRNRDGRVDAIFRFRGPSDLLSAGGFDPAPLRDVRDILPREFWVEAELDEDFDGTMDHFKPYPREAPPPTAPPAPTDEESAP
jgi:hypothetical protein